MWNIIDHLAYAAIFGIIILNFTYPNLIGTIGKVLLGFSLAWLAHFIHNVLVMLYIDTIHEIYVAWFYRITSPIIIIIFFYLLYQKEFQKIDL